MTAATTTSERWQLGYRPELDGIRGVAILLVALFHAGVLSPGAGQAGVTLFFVLSGFLITSLLLVEHRDGGRIRFLAFYGRRALRLVPALVTLCVSVALWYAITGRGSLIVGDVAPALFYAANWMIVAGEDQGLLGHTWSLAIEEHFYLVWPAALLAVLRWPRVGMGIVVAWILVAMTLRAVAHTPESHAFLMLSSPTRLDAPLVGCLIAVAAVRGRPSVPVLAGVLGAVAIGFAAIFANVTAIVIGGIGIATFGSALLLASMEGRRVPLLALPPLVWLGRVSYGLYLWHQPIMQELRPVLDGPLEAPILLALSIVAAAASYQFVEKPFLRLKSRSSHSRPKRPPERAGSTARALDGTLS